MTKKSTIQVIPASKPRNPLVAPAMKRKAGKHKDRKRESKNNPKD